MSHPTERDLDRRALEKYVNHYIRLFWQEDEKEKREIPSVLFLPRKKQNAMVILRGDILKLRGTLKRHYGVSLPLMPNDRRYAAMHGIDIGEPLMKAAA